MRTLSHLFENNRAWAATVTPGNSTDQPVPEYLWIGCADSRLPACQLVGLPPGQLFVHRNVANVVDSTDLNCLSVVQFAVDVQKVKHIIVCGHYGCGGVRAALRGERLGLIDNWLRHVVDVREKHRADLAAIANEAHRWDRLCELNVIEQAVNVCQTTIVRDAWARGQELSVHGWIYAVGDGLLRDLKMCVTGPDELASLYEAAVKQTRTTERQP